MEVKIFLLILLVLYCIFLFVVFQRIKTLNHTVIITASHASKMIQVVAIIQLLLAVSLFLLALVIV